MESTESPIIPFMEGSFALYQVAGVGMVVAYRTKEMDQDKQIVIPEQIINLASQFSGSSAGPLELFNAIKALA